jgi:hypothetical protein
MSLGDDPADRMAHFPSLAHADRLLSGDVALEDLPDESAPLARLLAGMRELPAADAFTARRVVSEMTETIVGEPAVAGIAARGRRLSAKAGALAFVAVLATGTAAAAATGLLPPRLQAAVANVLSHVAISVPNPEHNSIESHHGGPDGRPTGGVAPGTATEPGAPRGVQHGKDDDTTPRGATKTTPGGTTTGPHDNGRHLGPPVAVPTGSGVDNGNHNGDANGHHNGADNGNKNGNGTQTGTGTDNGQHKGADNGNGNKTTTPTTVKQHDNQNSNAGVNGNGSANSHASPQASGAHANGNA